MAGLFSDLAGIRRPEVVLNSGPLPSASGLPSAFNATTDAHINYGSTLLGDIDAYSYGEPDRLSSQTSYMNIPHKIQKIIPELRLPDARDGTSTFLLSHAVDDGDVAFSIRVRRNAGTIDQMHTFERMELGHAVDPFVNLATVNYLLAGIQRYWNRPSAVKWHQFMVDTDFAPNPTQAKQDFTVRHALQFLRDIARPFGIAHGSEKQGGQHEGSGAPVSFPVNFITSLLISGRYENLVNMWRESDVSAGDDLIVHLAWLPICKPDGSMEYGLNHWRKGTIRQRFDYEEGGVNFGWQVVPAVFCLHPPIGIREGYDWRQHGYWHVARTLFMKGRELTQRLERESIVQSCYNDDSRFLRGSLLEGTFEPVWVQHGRLKLSAKTHVDIRGAGDEPPIQRRRIFVPPPAQQPPREPVEPPADGGAQNPPADGVPLAGDAAPIGAPMPPPAPRKTNKPRRPALDAVPEIAPV